MVTEKHICMGLISVALVLSVISYLTSNLAFLITALGVFIIGAIFGTMYYWYWNINISKFYITTSILSIPVIVWIAFMSDNKYEAYYIEQEVRIDCQSATPLHKEVHEQCP